MYSETFMKTTWPSAGQTTSKADEGKPRPQSARGLLQAIVEGSTDAIFAKDLEGRYLLYNSEAARQMGRPAELVIGRDDTELFPPETARSIRLRDSEILSQERTVTFEERLPTTDGERIFSTTKGPMRNEQGQVIGIFGISRDMTEIKKAEEEVRIAALAFDSREGMLVTDARAVIQRVNRAFTEVTGYSAEEAIGRTPAMLRSDRHDQAFYRRLWESIAREGSWRGQIWNRRKDGQIYPEWLSISAIRDQSGEITHYFASFSDISEPKEAERRISELAFYDPLTDLPNRRLFLDRLEQALFASARTERRGALCLLDLDNFKRLNDTRGHDVGDQLLVEVARRLRRCVRQGDTVARLGGDEFVVLIDELGRDDIPAASHAEAVTEKIREALERPFVLSGIEVRITTSIGVSLFPTPAEGMDDLLKHADLALYAAKEAGRNRARFFNPEMQAAIDARTELEAGLHRALANGEFLLHYQPQVATDGRLIGVEALLRWEGRDGAISPGHFVPLAEETGLILPIGDWVLETACRQIAEWSRHPATGHIHVSVNISPRQFRQPDFVTRVQSILNRTTANPRHLVIEVTEGLIADGPGGADGMHGIVETMGELKRLGVGLSMDDFGTGYSSLSRLKHVPLDELKIDRSFVQDVVHDPHAEGIVVAIISMCQSLGLRVVAEGVETDAQRRVLESHGCHVHQGFLFSPAVPADHVPGLLQPPGHNR